MTSLSMLKQYLEFLITLLQLAQQFVNIVC